MHIGVGTDVLHKIAFGERKPIHHRRILAEKRWLLIKPAIVFERDGWNDIEGIPKSLVARGYRRRLQQLEMPDRQVQTGRQLIIPPVGHGGHRFGRDIGDSYHFAS
ncbi:hypothetical protein D3C87_1681160 [compost metagenome]